MSKFIGQFIGKHDFTELSNNTLKNSKTVALKMTNVVFVAFISQRKYFIRLLDITKPDKSK